MAAYAVVDWVSTIGSLASVCAQMETYLETKDSTTNAVLSMGIEKIGNETFQGFIIHAG